MAGTIGCGSSDDDSSGETGTESTATTTEGTSGADGGDTTGGGTTATSSEPTTEEGSTSGATSSGSTTATAECGNGIVEPGEQCDDGNTDEDDDCYNNCEARCGMIWSANGSGLSATFSAGVEVAADGGGNLFATGYFEDANENDDAWVGAYDTDGGAGWTGQFLGVDDQDDWATAVAADGDGNVVIAGTTETATNGTDIFVRKFDSSGAELWTKTIDGPQGGDDEAWGVATTAAGDVVVSGTIRQVHVDPVLGDSDLWVRKYESDGTELWTETYSGTSEDDYSLDDGGPVAVDSGGNVVVMGRMRLTYDTNDWILVKYGPGGGAPVWDITVDIEKNTFDPFHEGVAVDSDGNVVATYSWTGPSTSSHLFLVFKYDSDGNELWSADPATIGFHEKNEELDNAGHYSGGVAIDSLDNIVVVGRDTANGNPWVLGLDPGGEIMCLRVEAEEDYIRGLEGVVIDPDENIFAIGQELDIVAGVQYLWVAKFRR
jgi:cysteine-rich repeat protein